MQPNSKGATPEAYEAMLESESPPTPTQLAKLGTHRNPLHTPNVFQAATKYLGAIDRLKDFLLIESSPLEIIAGFGSNSELVRASKHTSVVLEKLQELQEALEWELNQNSAFSTTKSRARTYLLDQQVPDDSPWNVNSCQAQRGSTAGLCKHSINVRCE